MNPPFDIQDITKRLGVFHDDAAGRWHWRQHTLDGAVLAASLEEGVVTRAGCVADTRSRGYIGRSSPKEK
jgi:hypothetical protein